MVVLTASVGAGHDGRAREIAKRLIDAGHQADLVDLVDAHRIDRGVIQ